MLIESVAGFNQRFLNNIIAPQEKRLWRGGNNANACQSIVKTKKGVYQ
jgi:hypothetical protein